MAKLTTPAQTAEALSVPERLLLLCVASGIDFKHAKIAERVAIDVVVKGLIDRASGERSFSPTAAVQCCGRCCRTYDGERMFEHDQSWAQVRSKPRPRWADWDRRQALALLAKAGRRGEAHAALLANGVARSLIHDLVQNGHAMVVTTGPYAFTINTRASRIRITAAGRRLLRRSTSSTDQVRDIVERKWAHLLSKLPPRDE
jgi:hypothetical protein